MSVFEIFESKIFKKRLSFEFGDFSFVNRGCEMWWGRSKDVERRGNGILREREGEEKKR